MWRHPSTAVLPDAIVDCSDAAKYCSNTTRQAETTNKAAMSNHSPQIDGIGRSIALSFLECATLSHVICLFSVIKRRLYAMVMSISLPVCLFVCRHWDVFMVLAPDINIQTYLLTNLLAAGRTHQARVSPVKKTPREIYTSDGTNSCLPWTRHACFTNFTIFCIYWRINIFIRAYLESTVAL